MLDPKPMAYPEIKDGVLTEVVHYFIKTFLTLFQINGNVGKLLSCGIIARASGLFENNKRICACDGVSLWDERNKPLVGPERQQNKL